MTTRDPPNCMAVTVQTDAPQRTQMSRCAFSFSVAPSLIIPGFLVTGDDRDLR